MYRLQPAPGAVPTRTSHACGEARGGFVDTGGHPIPPCIVIEKGEGNGCAARTFEQVTMCFRATHAAPEVSCAYQAGAKGMHVTEVRCEKSE